MAAGMTEREFQDQVIALATLLGWKCHHVRAGMTRNGRYMTHVQGHVGFPDLVLAHPKRGVIFAELKSENGRVDDAQKAWHVVLSEAQTEVHVWRPKDWPVIQARLQA